MLLKLLIMLLSNAQKFPLLCSYYTQLCPIMPQICSKYAYLIQNSQAVKKVCGPQKGYGEKRCEIQGGGQEMAVMVG